MNPRRLENITIDRLLCNHAEQTPHKVAITSGNESITYAELTITVAKFATFLLEQEIGEGDILALAMDRTIDMIVSMLALLKIGAAYLPIDPEQPKERLDFLLKDSAAKKLLTEPGLEHKFSDVSNRIIFDQFKKNQLNYVAALSPEKDFSHHLAYILYTSGSTGMPKGVNIEQHNLHNFLVSMQDKPGINAHDTMLWLTTITFDIAELEIYLPLISGARLHIVDKETARDGRKLLEVIRMEKVSIVQATPFTWRMMLEFDWNQRLPIKALIGGEALPKELADKLLTRCRELWNMYGPTETTIWSLIKKISPDDELITIGKPILNTQVYLLNEQLQEVPPGEIGEIYIGGDGVGRGYVNRPDLTEKAFVPDHFSGKPGMLIYKTGDLGRMLPNEEIQCLGRIDHQVKIRGFRVETEEIESLLKKQTDVKESIVIAHKDEFENQRLVAYVVTDTAYTEQEQDTIIHIWRNELKRLLPDYMVPSAFQCIETIPLMSNGKVNRKALPAPDFSIKHTKITAPETELENELVNYWKQHIGIKNISTEDNFFELGGNSLIATRIMIQVEKYSGKRLPIASLFKFPTIKQLAAFIEHEHAEKMFSALVPIKESGTRPPLYIVHGIGLNVLNLRNLSLNMDADQPVYGLQAIGLNGIDQQPDTVEEIAAFYIKEIIQHQPEGAYAIAGYSLGGYIAFEMAKQFIALGKQISMLGMIDTNIQDPTHQFSLTKKVSRKSIRQFHKLTFRIRSFTTKPVDNFNYLKLYYKHRINSTLIKGYYTEDMPEFMVAIAKKLESVTHQYVLKPFDIVVDLFKADKRIYFVDDPKHLGWTKYALGGVNVYHIPGDHKEMLEPPNDKIFAKQLQDRLNRIAEKVSAK